MRRTASFIYATRGKGRPQIVLVGNGLEYASGQPSWEKLIDRLRVPDCLMLSKEMEEKIPFPLLYVLLSSHSPAFSQLTKADIQEEEGRLADAMRELKHVSNPGLDILPTLGADHIFTTNYSYCIENAFMPDKDFLSPNVRSRYRFNLSPLKENGKIGQEKNYRLHTGYLAKNKDGNPVGIWHIHGECTVSRGVVLGHDRYGRLISRIESICKSQSYPEDETDYVHKQFTSWPELFLYGDIYIIGLGYWLCDFDLWWLLRRKQRERFADGKVYFYDNIHWFYQYLVSEQPVQYDGQPGKRPQDIFTFSGIFVCVTFFPRPLLLFRRYLPK